ncbi:3-phosphoglycerate kinase [Pseudomonas sp. M30-35]|uniref:3-phosphoglycerate kinase n=1 Tax=Pseudomonas sp. M30-35 TaxID=1981174 RepID=UPI000B3CCA58|nr:3-phosphoglycerate kinase [Pseudomonas sp. M30-35]ARU89269.1 3-phosphoglycerate kinase [Pseudomonas sp. M30-35]
MKKLFCAVFTLLPLYVFAYPVEAEKQLNGAEISVTPMDIDDTLGAVGLYNYGQADAECKVIFRNGPEAPRTRKAVLKAGDDINLSVRFSRKIIKLRMQVDCKPS